jgi:pimeloyl-ACP methyl ester carboxylesterase
MKRAMALAAVAIAGLLMLKTLIGVLERRLVFFPSAGQDADPASLGITYQDVRLPTSDGETLVAWQLEPRNPIADVVYFHGNGGNLSLWLPILAVLHAQHLRVLAVDYRGYGLSTGRPSEEGLYLDAEAVARHAVASRKPGERPLIFWGRSLGGPVAASATHVVRPDGLILESSFPDKAAVVRSQPLLRVLNSFGAYRFDTVGLLEHFRGPVLVLHGNGDSIVPFMLGRELYDRLDTSKRFVEIEGADHNDLIDQSRADYWKPVIDFVAGLAGPGPTPGKARPTGALDGPSAGD